MTPPPGSLYKKKVIFSYIGNPGVGSLRITRRALENGALDWEEYSHFGMISRLQAGAAGLPFMPMRSTGAGELEANNPNYRQVTDPYSGTEVVVVPPFSRMSRLSTPNGPTLTETRTCGAFSGSRKRRPSQPNVSS